MRCSTIRRLSLFIFALSILSIIYPVFAAPIQIESQYDSVVSGIPVIFSIVDNTNGNSVILQYKDPLGNMKEIGPVKEDSSHTVRYVWSTKELVSGVYTFYAWDSTRSAYAQVPITIENGFITIVLVGGNNGPYTPGDTIKLAGIANGQTFVTISIEDPDGVKTQAGTANVALDNTWQYSWTANGTQSGMYKIEAFGSAWDTPSAYIRIELDVPASTGNSSGSAVIQQPKSLISQQGNSVQNIILPEYTPGVILLCLGGVVCWLYFRSRKTKKRLKIIRKYQIPGKPLIFISSKSADYQYANKLYEYLRSQGLSVFFSQETLPQMGNADYREEIDTAIDYAKHMIVVGSSVENITAPWVSAEWGAYIIEKRSGRKPDGNLIAVTVGSVKIDDIPLSLRVSEVIPYDPEKFPVILKYLS